MARTRIRLVAALATTAALAAPTTASAATATCGDLQDQLDAAPAFSVVTLAEGSSCNNHFDLPSRTITLEGGGSGATLSGQSKGNLQILAGHNVGGTTIRNLTFVEGLSQDNGGAIRLTGDSPVTIEDNTFIGNEAEDSGGAVSIDSLDGPVENLARGDATPVFLRGNTFGGGEEGDRNFADDQGGAVYIREPFRPVVIDEGNRFIGNEAENEGGGLSIDAARDLALLGNEFDGNESGDDGGGAFVNVCFDAEVTDNEFVGNTVANEGGSLEGGGLSISQNGCNDDKQRGGETGPQLTQSGNLFQGNSITGASGASGGGEYIESFITRSTNDRFVGNAVSGFNQAVGGGLAYFGFAPQPLVARNLVAAGNAAISSGQGPSARGISEQGIGGGLFLVATDQSEFRVADSTVEGNIAARGPGIAGGTLRGAKLASRSEVLTSRLVLQNSIVINGGPEDDDIFGFDDASRDVSFSDVCVEGAAHAGNGNLCADPALTAPDSDGNVDQTSSSPTIDKGDNSLVDIDLTGDYAGDARVLGGTVDMGADEYKPPTVEPEPEPTVQPPPPPPPPAAGGVQGVQQRSCTSKRAFRIRIRVPKGKKALSAVVRVNGKKVRVVRGKRLRAPVRLRGLPKGRFTVRITVRLANGKRITGTRRYHTCIPKLPGDGPPKV